MSDDAQLRLQRPRGAHGLQDGDQVARRRSDRVERADELAEAAQEFEAYFLKLLLAEMRKTVSGGGLFGGDDSNIFSDSSAEGYRALLDDALARHAARAGGIGLGDQLLGQWEKNR